LVLCGIVASITKVKCLGNAINVGQVGPECSRPVIQIHQKHTTTIQRQT
jgi:hypothetical protein